MISKRKIIKVEMNIILNGSNWFIPIQQGKVIKFFNCLLGFNNHSSFAYNKA